MFAGLSNKKNTMTISVIFILCVSVLAQPRGMMEWRMHHLPLAMDKRNSSGFSFSDESREFLTTVEPPECQWAYAIGSTEGYNGVTRAAFDASGNIILLGSYAEKISLGPFQLSSSGSHHNFLAKVSREGQYLWLKNIDFLLDNIQGSIGFLELDGLGHIYTGGYFTVAKFDADGNLVWKKMINCDGLAVDASGNCYISGMFYGTYTIAGFTLTAMGDFDIFVLKLDPSGEGQWIKQGGDIDEDEEHGSYECSPPYLSTDVAGNVIVFGSTIPTNGIRFDTIPLLCNDFIIKYDTNGILIWTRPDTYVPIKDLSTDANGDIYILGEFGGTITVGSHVLTSNENKNILLAKYTTAGDVPWAKKLGSNGSIDDESYGIATAENNHSVVLGYAGGTIDFGGSSVAGDFSAKYDESGELKWIRQFSPSLISGVEGGRLYDFDVTANDLFLCGSFRNALDIDGLHLTSITEWAPGYIAYFKESSYRENQLAASNTDLIFNAGSTKPGDGHSVLMNLNAMSGSGQICVSQLNNAPIGAPSSQALGVYWSIQTDAGLSSLTANLTFHYTDADVTGIFEDTAHLGLAFFNSTSQTWEWLGGTINALDNTITVAGIFHFSRFGMFGTLFGDANQDGYVDGADLQRLGDCWHETYGGEYAAGSDGRFFNYNKNTNNENYQIIDAADLQVFGDCWHNGSQQ